jgi:hypothetical protein
MPLRDLPHLVREAFVEAISVYLEVETSSEIAGALRTLSQQYSDVVAGDRGLEFGEDWYRDLAEDCWEVIAAAC